MTRHSSAVQKAAERLNSAPEVAMVPSTPEPPQPPRTPAQQAQDETWGDRLAEVERIVRSQVGPILSSGRSGSKAWVVMFSREKRAEAEAAIKRAGYVPDIAGFAVSVVVDLASLDRDLDRLRSEERNG